MAKEKVPHRQTVRRYQLEKYTGKNSRHTCPNCGHKHTCAKYVDVTTGDYCGDDIGRCNRTERCGYETSPKDNKGQDLYVPSNTVKKEYLENNITNTIDSKFVLKSMEMGDNNFFTFLYNTFDKDIVNKILNRYKVGSDNLWKGATVFWQIDRDYDVRTGKIMLYHAENGKRVKEPYAHLSWAHVPDKRNKFGSIQDYNLTQCFFGEHLLNDDSITAFNVVESEKTAILCSIANPDTYWIATGGLQNINEERLLPFKDKVLTFYPDKGKAFSIWEDKLKPFVGDYQIKISKAIEKAENLEEGEDIGDYILYKHLKTEK